MFPKDSYLSSVFELRHTHTYLRTILGSIVSIPPSELWITRLLHLTFLTLLLSVSLSLLPLIPMFCTTFFLFLWPVLFYRSFTIFFMEQRSIIDTAITLTTTTVNVLQFIYVFFCSLCVGCRAFTAENISAFVTLQHFSLYRCKNYRIHFYDIK